MATYAELTYIAERLGGEATTDDACKVADLAAQLSQEQGESLADFQLLHWLDNRTYDWTRLWEAAGGDVGAILEIRTEAGLPMFSTKSPVRGR